MGGRMKGPQDPSFYIYFIHNLALNGGGGRGGIIPACFPGPVALSEERKNGLICFYGTTELSLVYSEFNLLAAALWVSL